MKTITNIIYSTIAVFALACFGLLPKAQAVSPAPDGGYPGGNTAEGQAALLSLTKGTYNTAVGYFSLKGDMAGTQNTAIGAGALLANTGDANTYQGCGNTATGAGALLSNTTGLGNTASGVFALFKNFVGSDNTAVGESTLFSNTNGSDNTAVGAAALGNSIGDWNTAVGAGALGSTTGGGNTAIGWNTLFNNTTGDYNTVLGFQAGGGIFTANNVICIGTDGNNVSNSCYIGNIFNATSSGGTAVFVNSNGRLGTATSSRRFKEEIKPMDKASEAILALKPVTFRYKQELDPEHISQFGLVAEEVEKVNPDLVVRDKEGRPYSVRYDQVNAMLLNEFLKEHRKVEEQNSRIQQQEATISELKSTVAQQQKGLQTVTTRLEQQAAQIQKVSVELEMSKRSPHVVATNP